jgi:hypothetical protein
MVTKRRRIAAAPSDEYALIRRLIWLYLILWLIEGGLRRWFLPGLATPLLLVRDPLVMLIYILAAGKNLFPKNGFVITGVVLAILTFINALAIGHGNLLVAAYGVRCDFLHVPLIFVMGRVLRREDLLRVCKVAVWLVIPYTMLLVAQFEAPQDAWVNRGLGGSLEGAGFSGALDKFRPPGTFSFITGPAALYPLFAACWFMLVLARKLPAWLMVASGVAILVAIPVSISRGLFLAVILVAVVGTVVLFIGGRLSGGVIMRAALAAVLLPILASQLPVFKDGMEAFGARWQDSTTDAGGVQEAIIDRVVDGFTGPFHGVALFGAGTGFSTNVGQKSLTGALGFGGSEGEWGRLFYDNGFVLGLLLVGYRTALAGTILIAALRAWGRRSPEAMLFLASGFLGVLNGQWGQATSLGAAAIAGGLTLAAAGGLGEKQKSKKQKVESGNITAEDRRQRSEVGGEGSKVEETPFAVNAPNTPNAPAPQSATPTSGLVISSPVSRGRSSKDEPAPFSVTAPKPAEPNPKTENRKIKLKEDAHEQK